MKRCIFAGSFDPLTNGHVHIVEKSVMMFDEVVVALGVNPDKKSMFSVDLRLEMLKIAFKDYKNISVKHYSGLLSDFVQREGIPCLVRGARNEQEIKEDEKQFNLAFLEFKDVELIFFPSPKPLANVSSSMVKKLLSEGKNIEKYVPKEIVSILVNKRI